MCYKSQKKYKNVYFHVNCNYYARVYIKTSIDGFDKCSKLAQFGQDYRITLQIDPKIKSFVYLIYTSEFFVASENYDGRHNFYHEVIGTRDLENERKITHYKLLERIKRKIINTFTNKYVKYKYEEEVT